MLGSLTKSILSNLTSSIVSPAILSLPVTAGLTAHLSTKYKNLPKSSLVNVDGSERVDTKFGLDGTGLDASQSVQLNKPLYVVNAINGFPAIRFDGATGERYLTIPNSDNNSNFNPPHTIFVVAKPAINNRSIITKGLSLGGAALLDWDIGNFGGLFYRNINDDVPFDQVAPTTTSPTFNTSYITMGQWDGTTDTNAAKLFLNGALADEKTSPFTNFSFDELVNIGGRGANSFDGFIGEEIMYNRILTAIEIQKVFFYLSQNWNIPLT